MELPNEERLISLITTTGAERVVVVKGRAAVDAQCPIATHSHVLEEDDDVWDCMLNQVRPLHTHT